MKKMKYCLLAACCIACFFTAAAQDSITKPRYDKAPPAANPKQLNRTTAVQKDLNSQVQQKATNQYGPPPTGQRNAPPSNPYGTLPKKPANAPDNQITDPQNGYDDVPPPPAGSVPPSNNYGKAPPMANPKQLNRTTPVQKDLNSQVQQKATNQYGPPPGQRNAPPSNPYGTLPKKPANAPDNQITDPQNGYDDVPPPPAGTTAPSNNYGKAPPMANPKQLNRTTPVQKDLNSQVQQKATNQYGPPPVSGSAASNPKSQYGPLPAPGRTHQYGPAPALPKTTAPAAAVNSNTKLGTAPAQPASSGRTQQYGTVPPLPRAATPAKKG